ncbi:HEAT repeat domain-containing protein [Gammaproteobacteria bacterium]
MALVKKGSTPLEPDHRGAPRNQAGLLEQLTEDDPEIRRWAALDLGGYPDSADRLCAQLEQETQAPVREALFTSLIHIGNPTVVKGLLPLLRSDDAALRNGVINALQHFPEAISPYMEAMLRDTDSDYRIFAINVLTNLRHPKTPQWLREVIENDKHINVCATAVDLLTEVGGLETLPALEALPARFNQDPFLRFATEVAIRRIRAENR